MAHKIGELVLVQVNDVTLIAEVESEASANGELEVVFQDTYYDKNGNLAAYDRYVFVDEDKVHTLF